MSVEPFTFINGDVGEFQRSSILLSKLMCIIWTLQIQSACTGLACSCTFSYDVGNTWKSFPSWLQNKFWVLVSKFRKVTLRVRVIFSSPWEQGFVSLGIIEGGRVKKGYHVFCTYWERIAALARLSTLVPVQTKTQTKIKFSLPEN